MDLLIRISSVALLLGLTGFCAFGFLASYELNAVDALGWQLGYLTTGLGTLAIASRLCAAQRPPAADGGRTMRDPTEINAVAAWLGVLAGVLTGVVTGLFFHRPGWLGGYGSWPRRLFRLGHIACFGIAALNLGFALTVRRLGWHAPLPACVALAAAGGLMPAVCFLTAWRQPFRHLFFLPVTSVLFGVVGLLWQRVLPWFG